MVNLEIIMVRFRSPHSSMILFNKNNTNNEQSPRKKSNPFYTDNHRWHFFTCNKFQTQNANLITYFPRFRHIVIFRPA